MKFNITATIVHHHYNHSDDETKSLLKTIIKNQNKTMATLAEVQQSLVDLQTSVDTKQAAIAAAIAALEATIANFPVAAATEADLQAIVDGLKVVRDDVDSTPTGTV